jgi:hypothetical protein
MFDGACAIGSGDSALSRLINKVEAALRQISAELGLLRRALRFPEWGAILLLMIETIAKRASNFKLWAVG